MELWEAIEKRRTIRKFSGKPREEQIQRVLEAGAMAPSAGNKQAWFVVIVNDPATIAKLGEIKRSYNATWTPDTDEGRARLDIQKNVFHDCTSMLFYTFAPEPDDPHRADTGSVWLLVENLCLAAEAEGLGTQIFGVAGDAEEKANKLLGVPSRYKHVAGVNIGVAHPDYRIPEKVLKPKSEWIFREKWPTG